MCNAVHHQHPSTLCSPFFSFLSPQREAERKAAAAALMDEVARGNAELAQRKRAAKVAEVEEAAAIAEYIRQKDAREQASGWVGGKAVASV